MSTLFFMVLVVGVLQTVFKYFFINLVLIKTQTIPTKRYQSRIESIYQKKKSRIESIYKKKVELKDNLVQECYK